MSATKEGFNDRFKKLFHERETQEQFAQRVGLNRNTVAKYKSATNNTAPDAGVIISICQACNVSADWLLGLIPPDIIKPDPSLQAACEYLGLSEEAVENIHNLLNKPQTVMLADYEYTFDCKKILDRLLSNPAFIFILANISEACDFMEQYQNQKANKPDGIEDFLWELSCKADEIDPITHRNILSFYSN